MFSPSLVCGINVCLVQLALDTHENVRQSNLQLVFLQTISHKGATSRYFRVFRENLSLITSLKIENGNVEFLYR